MTRKTLSVVVLAAIGLAPVGRLICELSCDSTHTMSATEHAHCQAPADAGTRIAAVEPCIDHGDGQITLGVQTTVVMTGIVNQRSGLSLAVSPQHEVLSALSSRGAGPPDPPRLSVLRI